jgi:hypothetical protein
VLPLDAEARMIRRCIQCRQIIGEKCALCGTSTPPRANSNPNAVTVTEFNCPAYGHHFSQGDGGETGGICETCFDAELRKAHEHSTTEGR